MQVFDLKTNRLGIVYKFNICKRQVERLVLSIRSVRKLLGQLSLIERRSDGVLIRIHQDKFDSLGTNSPIPKAIGLFDPAGLYIRHENNMP